MWAGTAGAEPLGLAEALALAEDQHERAALARRRCRRPRPGGRGSFAAVTAA
ncbi:MAG: hypothetical protein R3F43_32780 [bacterium]